MQNEIRGRRRLVRQRLGAQEARAFAQFDGVVRRGDAGADCILHGGICNDVRGALLVLAVHAIFFVRNIRNARRRFAVSGGFAGRRRHGANRFDDGARR